MWRNNNCGKMSSPSAYECSPASAIINIVILHLYQLCKVTSICQADFEIPASMKQHFDSYERKLQHEQFYNKFSICHSTMFFTQVSKSCFLTHRFRWRLIKHRRASVWRWGVRAIWVFSCPVLVSRQFCSRKKIVQIDSNFGVFTRIAFARHLTRDALMFVTWATTRH